MNKRSLPVVCNRYRVSLCDQGCIIVELLDSNAQAAVIHLPAANALRIAEALQRAAIESERSGLSVAGHA